MSGDAQSASGTGRGGKSPGIVLVDEIELHLHPRWQRTIVGDLRKTFPLMRFILTIHSESIRKEGT